MKDNDGVIAVYLAAGKSRRMGVNKLALPWGQKTVGNSALEKAVNSKLDYTIVVTRDEDTLKWIDGTLFGSPLRERWKALRCRDADKGQAHSLQCGLLAAMEMEPKGIMILLADQPLLPVEIINDLVKRYLKIHQENKEVPFIAASFQGIPRPPIIFSPKVVPDLQKLEGDEGARQLIKKEKLTGILVNYENGWDFFDVDTKEEYDRLKGWRHEW
ncbi:NTP transferase domain-containing protein [Bacillus sp. ISL-75]|uniref:NTP transferase domain-containing protein n=1 Tax=Bacillus sp. ISL-75 TaxID=2819137 RepID=UPI001BE55B71|nr:NTP transferase domain-containing protein [Bacillus sp. ISL-75]MBT2728706.1 NTP transferase domain-containing protein [Bacillus sp. ISL-75]